MEELIKKTIAELRRDASSGWTGGPAAAKVLEAAFAEVRRAAIEEAREIAKRISSASSASAAHCDTIKERTAFDYGYRVALHRLDDALLPPAAEEKSCPNCHGSGSVDTGYETIGCPTCPAGKA